MPVLRCRGLLDERVVRGGREVRLRPAGTVERLERHGMRVSRAGLHGRRDLLAQGEQLALRQLPLHSGERLLPLVVGELLHNAAEPAQGLLGSRPPRHRPQLVGRPQQHGEPLVLETGQLLAVAGIAVTAGRR
jgi:hypothetical protein